MQWKQQAEEANMGKPFSLLSRENGAMSHQRRENMEPAIVEKVRQLLGQRVRKFEDGGPHTATFFVHNDHSACFLDERYNARRSV